MHFFIWKVRYKVWFAIHLSVYLSVYLHVYLPICLSCWLFSSLLFVSAVPPVLSVFQQSFNATADYQESVTFTCITSGSPDPVVTWHRYFPPWYAALLSDPWLRQGFKICRTVTDEGCLWTQVESKYFCQIHEHQSAAGTSLLQDSGLWLREHVPGVLTNMHDTGDWWRAGPKDLTMGSKWSRCNAEGEKFPPVGWWDARFKPPSSRSQTCVGGVQMLRIHFADSWKSSLDSYWPDSSYSDLMFCWQASKSADLSIKVTLTQPDSVLEIALILQNSPGP